jgi:dienelactone hydrolase
LRSLLQVDDELIGVAGVSWGGYLTLLAASVDSRFAFAVPIYGCGYLHENSSWVEPLKSVGEANRQKWIRLWEPSSYLANSQMPMLWINGTNDNCFPLDSYKKSYSLVKGELNLSIKVRLAHNHGGLSNNQEIYAFADSICKGKVPLLSFTDNGTDDKVAWARYKGSAEPESAELVFTCDEGVWKDRYWDTVPVEIDEKEKRLSAVLPAGVSVWYFNITDARGNISSSPHCNVSP